MSERPPPLPRATATTLGRLRRPDELDVETGAPAPVGDEVRQLSLARGAGDECRVDGVDRDEARGEIRQRGVSHER